MDDGKTRVLKYPNVGATCKGPNPASGPAPYTEYVQLDNDYDPGVHIWGPDPNTLQDCPDFDERHTLTDGKTLGVPFPNEYYNCKIIAQKSEPNSLIQKSEPNWGPNVNTLPHCPDFDERFTLADGKTRAIPYPQIYYNCKADYQLQQREHQLEAHEPNWGPNVNALPHCPDFDERFTLTDGVTKAIPYPQVYYNCKSDYQLHEMKHKKKDPNWGPSVDSLPHCPDFDERFTLTDGVTKAIPYPQVYYNCKSDYQMTKKAKKTVQPAAEKPGMPYNLHVTI